ADNRLAGGVLPGRLGGLGARCPSCGEGRLAGGRAHCHVLTHYVADCEQAEREEDEDQRGNRPLDQRLCRLPPHHAPDPGWKRSTVWTERTSNGTRVKGGKGSGSSAGASA